MQNTQEYITQDMPQNEKYLHSDRVYLYYIEYVIFLQVGDIHVPEKCII